MARPADFYEVPLGMEHEQTAQQRAAEMGVENPWAWVGLAAEYALLDAINSGPAAGKVAARMSPDRRWDLELHRVDGGPAAGGPTRVEVKTRVATEGWTDPCRFEWIAVPTHEGREPVKPEAHIVLFCWWSASDPRRLWVLGRLLGANEFRRRAQWYAEGELTPRGGEAPPGGTYILDVASLRPLTKGLLPDRRSE